MTHLDFDQLNDLLDGRVGDADRTAMETHRALCGDCDDQYRRLARLVTRAAALPDEFEPPPGLWQTIHARVAVSDRPRRRWHWQLAAAVLLIALTSTITARLVRHPVLVVRHETPAASPGVAPIPAAVRSVDADYVAIVHQLTETLAERRAQLSPQTVAKVEASLRVIDLAIGEARAALEADPANRDLVDLLAGSYRQKIELLRRASELTSST
jgi:hypothetical protein